MRKINILVNTFEIYRDDIIKDKIQPMCNIGTRELGGLVS